MRKNNETQLEIQAGEFMKKISDLKFENSLLSQKNKILEKKLESITSKYNDLKNEILDIEEHINFCKDNQLKMVEFKENPKNDQKMNKENFLAFKNKIKILFGYDDKFINTNSDVGVYNMIVDNINDILNENTNLKQTIEKLKTLIDQKNNDKITNNSENYDQNDDNYNENNIDENISNENSYGMNNYECNDNYNFNDGQNYELNHDYIIKRNNNSKQCINNLMNNLENLQNAIGSDDGLLEIPDKKKKRNYMNYLDENDSNYL